jgi:hypothetical protein
MADDVMAHVHTFGTVAPDAAGIIQWVPNKAELTKVSEPLLAMSPSESLRQHELISATPT